MTFPVGDSDRRVYESIIKALILLLGTEVNGTVRITFDSHEINRVHDYELHIGRNLDPYRMILEVELR